MIYAALLTSILVYPGIGYFIGGTLSPSREDNISVGTTILRSMLDRYGEEKAIAAYNGLLPEKHEYTSKVQAILSRAGLPPEAQKLSSNLSFLAAVSDGIEALQVVPHSQKLGSRLH
jgi:hypothetical protein